MLMIKKTRLFVKVYCWKKTLPRLTRTEAYGRAKESAKVFSKWFDLCKVKFVGRKFILLQEIKLHIIIKDEVKEL